MLSHGKGMRRHARDRNVTTEFLEAATSAAHLLAMPEVAANWHNPSAVREWAFSSLASHLARQVTRLPSQLQLEPPAGTELITLLDHYSRVPWTNAPLCVARTM
jgi:hypothetical protein